jgi:hypothetical protein
MGKAFVVFGQVAQGNRPRYGNKARWRHYFSQLNAHDLLPELYLCKFWILIRITLAKGLPQRAGQKIVKFVAARHSLAPG